MSAFSAIELEYLQQQLGKRPDGAIAIAAKSATGVPLVLQMRAWHKQPFPTLYWLVSKDLHRAIAKLETQGLVKQLEQRLQLDEALMQAYQADHKAYVARRWELMLEQDKLQLTEQGQLGLFDTYGIGGIANWQQIRCLHMQYAQHLVMGNCIGDILDKEFLVDQTLISI